jgi:hypothetical protein
MTANKGPLPAMAVDPSVVFPRPECYPRNHPPRWKGRKFTRAATTHDRPSRPAKRNRGGEGGKGGETAAYEGWVDRGKCRYRGGMGVCDSSCGPRGLGLVMRHT